MEDSWDEYYSKLSELEDEEIDELTEKFNKLIPDHEDLADCLFGERDAFITKMAELQSEEKEIVFNALKEEGILDKRAGKQKDDTSSSSGDEEAKRWYNRYILVTCNSNRHILT